jgi:hypothetical protein
MTATTKDSEETLIAKELRLDRLLGQPVLARNNQRVGRIEEFHAEKRGTGLVLAGYVIGPVLFGRKRGGYLATWDQIDISDPSRPRLTCPVEELTPI